MIPAAVNGFAIVPLAPSSFGLRDVPPVGQAAPSRRRGPARRAVRRLPPRLDDSSHRRSHPRRRRHRARPLDRRERRAFSPRIRRAGVGCRPGRTGGQPIPRPGCGTSASARDSRSGSSSRRSPATSRRAPPHARCWECCLDLGSLTETPASTEVEAGIRTLVLCQALLHEASLMATIRAHHEDVEVEGCRQPRRRSLLLRGEKALHILEAAPMYIGKDQSVTVGIHQPVAAEVPSPSVAATRFPQHQALPLGHAANPVLSHFVGRFWHNKLTTTLRG
jgi:hypothetical protein